MKNNNLLLLSVITILVVVAAVMVNRQRAPETSFEKAFLIPGLLDKVNDVSIIKISKQDKSLTLLQHDSQWVLADADNYSADFGKIRETVLAVAEMTILAEKTSKAENYERLGIEQPSAENNSALIVLQDNSDSSLASLIVGNTRHSKSAEAKPGLYVRLKESEQALLVEGSLDISVEVKDWLQLELFSIDADRVKEIQIVHENEDTVMLKRELSTDDFNLEDLAEGKEMQPAAIISRMGTMLENVSAENVRKSLDPYAAKKSTTRIQTFDGLIINIANAHVDDNHYSTFDFSVGAFTAQLPEEEGEKTEESEIEKADPVAEAANLNKIMSGWTYIMPSFKYELFTRNKGYLSKDIEKTEEASTSE
jgi:hypothetical protein